MTSGEATNSLGKAWRPESTGICESWQARVRPNCLCDFYTYFQARMRVFVFVTYSSPKHVNPSRQLAHKDSKACDIAARHTARPCVLHMLSVLPSSDSMARKMLLLLAVPAMCYLLPPHTTPTTPTSWKLRSVTYKLALGHCHVRRVMGPLLGHDFREGHKLAESSSVARQRRNVQNMW